MRTLKVYNNEIFAGTLSELPGGKYSFKYDKEYFDNPEMSEISITLPKKRQEYISDEIFPFFTNMLPEGWNRRMVCRQCKIDENDFFGLLEAMRGADFIGAISIQ